MIGVGGRGGVGGGGGWGGRGGLRRQMVFPCYDPLIIIGPRHTKCFLGNNIILLLYNSSCSIGKLLIIFLVKYGQLKLNFRHCSKSKLKF